MRQIVYTRRYLARTRTYLQYAFLFWNDVQRQHHVPIIIYQMGKVGSSSIDVSLKHSGVPAVFHVHRMNPAYMFTGKRQHNPRKTPLAPHEMLGQLLFTHVLQKQRPARIITLVREPISRNISGFFQNVYRFTGDTPGTISVSTDTLIEQFLTTYAHGTPAAWFEHEPKQTLGIDVYAYSFDKEQGYTTIQHGPFDMLILQSELEDAAKAAAIGDFLDIPNFTLKRQNVGSDKYYAEHYQRFKQQIQLPLTYLDTMCQSQYTRHFYSDAAIERVYATWSRTSG
ncbi:MAG: hypothetical protein HC837_00105 [Chloroflexaceae bacterium]|nr:hypothetical protein [Chloroflexaceae bacterium]